MTCVMIFVVVVVVVVIIKNKAALLARKEEAQSVLVENPSGCRSFGLPPRRRRVEQ